MLDKVPEDVANIVARQITEWVRGEGMTKEEKDVQRKLRDSTFASLASTSRELSNVWISHLYRRLAVSILNFESLYETIMSTPSLFIETRSLDLAINEDLYSEEQFAEFRSSPIVVKNSVLAGLQKFCLEPYNKSPEGNLVPRIGLEAATLTASMYSTMLESLPNLEYLRFTGEIGFQFVRRENQSTARAYQVRPLLGLQSLKVLHLVPNIEVDSNSLHTASNGIWLMTFLENLTHLQIFSFFLPQDERFLELHKETFTGRSKVTHLDLSFRLVGEFRSLGKWVATGTLVHFLAVTKGLVELKLRNAAAPVDTKTLHLRRQFPTVGFLRCLASSSETLRYLSLVGNFHDSVSLMEALNVGNWDRLGQPVIFKALECLSADGQTYDAFGSNAYVLFHEIRLPALEKVHLYSDQKGGLANQFPERSLSGWINMDFPEVVKEIIVSEKPVGGDGNIIDLGDFEKEWRTSRSLLKTDCLKKGLVLKILKEGEEIPYGRMPEPEDF